MIQTVRISPEMEAEATELASRIPLIPNSIQGGRATTHGVLGELVYMAANGGTRKDTYDYDVIHDDGTRVEVKTKRTRSYPDSSYECSVAVFNATQGCDEYAFVRVLYDMSRGWYLGSLPRDEYFEKARFLRRGETDGSNGFTVKADCYNVAIRHLRGASNVVA